MTPPRERCEIEAQDARRDERVASDDGLFPRRDRAAVFFLKTRFRKFKYHPYTYYNAVTNVTSLTASSSPRLLCAECCFCCE